MKFTSPVLTFMTIATAVKAGIFRACDIDAVESAGENFYKAACESWPAEVNYFAAPVHQEDEFLKIALSQSQKVSDEKQEVYRLGVSCLSSEDSRRTVSAIIHDVDRRLVDQRKAFFARPAHAEVMKNAPYKQEKLENGKAKLKERDHHFDDSVHLKMPSSQPGYQPRNRKKANYPQRDEL